MRDYESGSINASVFAQRIVDEANLAYGPDEIMFFDDNALNVRGAEEFGFKALLIDEFCTLQRWLADRGIVGDATV